LKLLLAFVPVAVAAQKEVRMDTFVVSMVDTRVDTVFMHPDSTARVKPKSRKVLSQQKETTLQEQSTSQVEQTVVRYGLPKGGGHGISADGRYLAQYLSMTSGHDDTGVRNIIDLKTGKRFRVNDFYEWAPEGHSYIAATLVGKEVRYEQVDMETGKRQFLRTEPAREIRESTSPAKDVKRQKPQPTPLTDHEDGFPGTNASVPYYTPTYSKEDDRLFVTKSELDEALTEAVRIGVRQALAEHEAHALLDTIPRTAAERIWDRSQAKRHIERVPRSMLKATFVPKGQWLLGGTINFQEWDTENINILVLKDIDLEGHVFTASPYFGYFVANNIAIGGRYNYSRSFVNLGKLNLNLGEDFNINLEDLYYLSHTHTASFFMRNYLPLSKSNVYGAFAEVRASYSRTTSKNTSGVRGTTEFDGSYGHTNALSLTMCPGLAVFVTDFLAVETSIDVMGFRYRWQDQKTNRVESGSSKSGGANFKFNFLSVNLGLTFFL